jgi:[acyl-carrier-protein] S-malonyltransferase
MARLALLFPGQGAQQVGMGKAIHDAFPAARQLYEEAADATGVDFARLSFEGPEGELKKTQNAQPAILIHSVACLKLLRQGGIDGDIAAGHSLGEYSAQVAAGSLAFRDAVRTVRLRGELMYEAGLRHPGTMAAILGLSHGQVEAVVGEAGAAGGILVAANLNAPTQVVISGEIAAVEQAMELARQAGAKRAVRLEVSGAFHSPLMASAAQGLAEALDAIAVADGRLPVVANATARPVTMGAEVRATLKDQLLQPVRWEQSMRFLVESGVAEAVELGPGTVLRGLMRSIAPEIRVQSAGDPEGLEAAVATLAGAGRR